MIKNKIPDIAKTLASYGISGDITAQNTVQVINPSKTIKDTDYYLVTIKQIGRNVHIRTGLISSLDDVELAINTINVLRPYLDGFDEKDFVSDFNLDKDKK